MTARTLPRALLTVLLAAVMIATMPPSLAHADPRQQKARVDERVEELTREHADLDRELARTIAERDAAQEALPDAEQALADAQDELADAEARDAELASRLTSAENAQSDLQREVEEGEEELERTQTSMTRIARQAYQNSGVTSEMALFLSLAESGNGATGMARVDSAVRSQQRAIGRLDQQRSVNQNNEAKLQAISEEIADLKEQAAEVVAEKEAAQAEAAARQAELEDLIDTSERASREIEENKASTQRALDEQREEQDRLAKEIEELIRKEEEEARKRGEAPSGGSSGLQNPAPGYPVTSPFGYRVHPITGTRRLHTGMDYGVPCGTPLRAAASGTVLSSGWAGGYGYRVVISHGRMDGAQIATTYSHNSSLRVRAGQRVNQGDIISISGTTGASTGCHLHFEVMRNGTYVNPAPYV
ncbi:M23 family metallopeptidase [Sediminivirga luteola]|uniref:Metalloendopeptidase n=1 Tax=Sediminivirga luteola TaxID=1774748 RepID=A0A8J2TYA5_9MICO|nr:M23 family metallopeptidase [Sediminivirga luteola]MCI2266492.1 peptidoglycan DD-metalloendopeptidase family protein [Sediminivirga luteola]GGA15136.1 metalloendopeptidase [Sediminivirga luteola]